MPSGTVPCEEIRSATPGHIASYQAAFIQFKRRVAELYKKHEKELIEANKILLKIEDDQFLDLMTVKTEIQSPCSINEVNQIAQLRIIIKPNPCIGVGPSCTAKQVDFAWSNNCHFFMRAFFGWKFR
ncbi:hypothetical protein LOK49_LG01G02298 [Camellia lanceoleosa]|uniref:Uncharacterized protein n=1 Tax=Camellia lanceoleosa TaxID=1840588 RepID=A0ACC0J2V2_9ERIC|nr:hypothetical protein LOK49_LG01G02298 [Camellia lanceoleosa]